MANKTNKKIIFSEAEIAATCKRLGKEITRKISRDKKPAVVVGVLKGAIPFMMDLVKQISTPIYLDFIQIKSYLGTKNTGKVQLIRDISFDCEDRTVIIVEDIVDTGASMSYLIKHFKSHKPKKVLVCALFDKKEARKYPVKIDFVGKQLEGNDFLLGYGLDYYEICRNIPYVYAATPEEVNFLDSLLEDEK